MNLIAELGKGHGYLGYVVLVLVIASIARAIKAKSDETPFEDGFPRLVGFVVALQVIFGLLVYVMGEHWGSPGFLAYLHPVLMVGAIATANIATARAKKAADATDAWAQIVRFQGISLALIVLGIGAASAA